MGIQKMRSEKIMHEINNLNLAEKLLLIEDVWDSIAQSNSDIPMPEWQKRELDRRYKEYQAGTQNLLDWQSVHEEIRNKYK
jgi:putative addiction module component (TIGR02574 family)